MLSLWPDAKPGFRPAEKHPHPLGLENSKADTPYRLSKNGTQRFGKATKDDTKDVDRCVPGGEN